MAQKKKDYYTIGEVSEIVDLKEHVIRFWEKEFDELDPQKLVKGQRKYRKYHQNDIEVIERIKILLYEEKFTISGAKIQLSEELGYLKPRRDVPIIHDTTPQKTMTSNSFSNGDKKKILNDLQEILHLLNQ